MCGCKELIAKDVLKYLFGIQVIMSVNVTYRVMFRL